MKIGAVPDDLKMISLLGCAMPKARKPDQRHNDGPAVHEINF